MSLAPIPRVFLVSHLPNGDVVSTNYSGRYGFSTVLFNAASDTLDSATDATLSDALRTHARMLDDYSTDERMKIDAYPAELPQD